jgi:type IV pilus assembly protein PilB
LQRAPIIAAEQAGPGYPARPDGGGLAGAGSVCDFSGGCKEARERKMAERKQRSIGRILIEKGIVTEEQVAHALEIQRENPKIRLGEALVQMQAANWDQVYEALSELLGYRFVDLRASRIPAEAIGAMSKVIARKHNIVPVGEEEGVLIVAITDPFDLYAMDSLRFYLNREVRCVLAAPDAVEEAINKYYGIEESTVDNMLAEFTESDLGIQTAIEASQEDGDDSAMIRLVTLLISEAVKMRASDIHIEPMKTKLRVRYRIDGNCQEMDSPPKRLQGPIISRVKILAGIDIAEKRRPTDGRISMRVGGQAFDIRVSCLPATNGESVVMRLLMKESVLINLQELGFHETDYRRFESIITRPNGIVLVTGPTGSGKTTTLYSVLNHVNDEGINVMTLEDPVEYPMAMIRQTSIAEAAKLDFANGIRSMMRQDPDVILVGEIRDTDTAEMAFRAAMTGHQVYSTLHTNSAIGAIPRLLDIGILPDIMAGNIIGVIAQRLVRRLCPQCRKAYSAEAHERRLLGIESQRAAPVIYRAAGCEYCEYQGYKGRLAIMELLRFDSDLDELVARRATTREIRNSALSKGFTTLAEDGLRRVLDGSTSLEEVARVADLTERM